MALQILRTHARIKLFFALLVLSLAGLAFAVDKDFLPVQNWNPTNLQRLSTAQLQNPTFAVIGDNKENFAVLGELLKQINKDPDIAFVIHIGDMVSEGNLYEYRQFFDTVRSSLQKPLLGVIGNHEYRGLNGGDLSRQIFGQNYYAFAAGDNYFIVIDDSAQTGPDAAQYEWLEQQLQQAQKYRTRLVFMHIPPFDPRGGKYKHCLLPACGKMLGDLFQKYKVTHLFAGHIHGYFAVNWDGLPYTITGGAGASWGSESDPRHYFFHYLKVSLQGGQVQVQAQPLQDKGAGKP